MLKIPKRHIRKSTMDMDNLENPLNGKGPTAEGIQFPIMGGVRGLMREENEDERAKLLKEYSDNYIKWYQKENYRIK
jgi:hypothetical protein